MFQTFFDVGPDRSPLQKWPQYNLSVIAAIPCQNNVERHSE